MKKERSIIPHGYVEIPQTSRVVYPEAQDHIWSQLLDRDADSNVVQEAISAAKAKTSNDRLCCITIVAKQGKDVAKTICCPHYLLPEEAKFEIQSLTQPTILDNETTIENVFVLVK